MYNCHVFVYAHFLYSTSCHKHFCKVNEQKQARRVEHSLYLPCCLKEVRIFDCVFSSPLLHSAWCSHVLQKDRIVLFITFIPLSPKYPSGPFRFLFLFCILYPLLPCPPDGVSRALVAAHPVQFLPLSQGTKVILHPRGCSREQRWFSIPGAAPAPGALPRQLWAVQTGMVLLHICGTLEVFVVAWLVGWFFLSLVFTVFFNGSIKQLQ